MREGRRVHPYILEVLLEDAVRALLVIGDDVLVAQGLEPTPDAELSIVSMRIGSRRVD